MKLRTLIYPTLYVGIWLIIVFLIPKETFHEGTGMFRWVVFGLIFILLPILLFKSIVNTRLGKNGLTILSFLSPFLLIPFVIWVGNEAEKELLEEGNQTQGIIVNAWEAHYKSRQDQWLVQAKYRVGNKYYRTSSKIDNNRTLTEGDTVTVIYSERTPQLSKIKELTKE